MELLKRCSKNTCIVWYHLMGLEKITYHYHYTRTGSILILQSTSSLFHAIVPIAANASHYYTKTFHSHVVTHCSPIFASAISCQQWWS